MVLGCETAEQETLAVALSVGRGEVLLGPGSRSFRHRASSGWKPPSGAFPKARSSEMAEGALVEVALVGFRSVSFLPSLKGQRGGEHTHCRCQALSFPHHHSPPTRRFQEGVVEVAHLHRRPRPRARLPLPG